MTSTSKVVWPATWLPVVSGPLTLTSLPSRQMWLAGASSLGLDTPGALHFGKFGHPQNYQAAEGVVDQFWSSALAAEERRIPCSPQMSGLEAMRNMNVAMWARVAWSPGQNFSPVHPEVTWCETIHATAGA